MLNVVLTSLTGTQLLKGLDINNKITTQLGGLAKAQATLDKINTVAKNQLQPTYDDVRPLRTLLSKLGPLSFRSKRTRRR